MFHPADEAGVAVDFHDVSTGGVSFSARQPLKMGQKGIIELLPTATAPTTQRFEVVIVWAVSNEMTRRCRVGCKWLVPLSDADLARFV
jgi:hypothetical protein